MDVKCSDCGKGTVRMKPETIAQAGPNREAGEALCGGCVSRRTLMVRAVEKLPTDLSVIRAKRMVS